MVIAADGQPEATFQAPPLKHDAAIGGGHALAEAMYAYAPANLGLIGTFCCHYLPRKKLLKHRTAVIPPGFSCLSLIGYGIGTGGNYNLGGRFGQTSLLSFANMTLAQPKIKGKNDYLARQCYVPD
jgi:hypothetical protein